MSKKSPQLRFEGFTDDWEERKLGEHSNILTGGTPKTSMSNYWNPKEIPWMSSGEVNKRRLNETDNMISKEGLENSSARWVKENSIVIALAGQGKTRGTVAVNNIPLTTNQSIAAIEPYETLNFEFIFQNLSKRYDELRMMSSGDGTRGGLNKKIIYDIIITAPILEEQQKIGSFFKQLDNTIALHQRKLDLLKEQKKGYLQKMFPKNGAKVPELRFAGFADDWEERKLSSGLREYTDRVIVEDDKEYYQISVRNNFGGITLRGSKIGNKIGRKRQAKINLTKYPQTLIFTRQTVEQGGIGWVDKYCDGAIVTENMPTISLDTSVFSKYFLTNLFQTRIFYKNAILDNIEGGSAQIAIHESKFLSSILLFPNLDEQEKIGQFFKQLDNTIALHQLKLDLLKEQKKGFLQKMFA